MKRELQIPLLIPIMVILIGSLISMFNAQVPLRNSKALIIDLYLFIFFIVLYNVIETKRELKIFILFWVIFAILQSSFMLGEIFPNFVKRAIGTFLNPNMGANYLGLSFFLIFQPYVMVRKFFIWLFGFFILTGMMATKSLAGIIGLFIGILVIIVLYWYRTKAFNKIKIISVVLVIAIIGILIFPEIAKVPNLLERFQKSFYGKSNLWYMGFNIFTKNPLGYGIGPAGFVKVGPKIKGPKFIKRELHSDWLSFLVERGLIGFIGLVLLFSSIFMMLLSKMKTVNSEREFLWVISLYGMFIFILINSFAHEILHFRHVWCAFAVIAIEYKLRKKNQEERQLAYEHQ